MLNWKGDMAQYVHALVHDLNDAEAELAEARKDIDRLLLHARNEVWDAAIERAAKEVGTIEYMDAEARILGLRRIKGGDE